MKIVMSLVFTTLTFSVWGQVTNKVKSPIDFDQIITDLNGDNRYDTILLSSSSQNGSSFNGITISVTGFGRKFFKARNSWTDVDSSFLSNNKNAIKSNKFFLLKAKDHSVILLFGFLDGAGYREDFSIINVKDSSPKLVFDKGEKGVDVEIPIALTDLNDDNKTDFVFRNYGERSNANVGTYNPFLIYTIDNDCKLNKPLTKKYNEVHYVFAGYEYSEKIKVFYPLNGGKPRIIK